MRITRIFLTALLPALAGGLQAQLELPPAGDDLFPESQATAVLAIGSEERRVECKGETTIVRAAPSGGVVQARMESMDLDCSGGIRIGLNPERESQGTIRANGESEFRVFVEIEGVPGCGPLRNAEPARMGATIRNIPPFNTTYRNLQPSLSLVLEDVEGLCTRYRQPRLQHIEHKTGEQPPEKKVKPVLQWVAKFDCGFQPSTPPPYLEAVKPGNYATKIVIHNPQGWLVEVEKKVAVGERNPRSGQISRWETFKLRPDAVTEVDCPDILRLLDRKPPPPGNVLPFFNGVVVVRSEKLLDVLANYTYELAKEKIEFRLTPPPAAPPALKALANKRLKWVQAVVQELIHDEEEEVRQALRKQFPGIPPHIIQRTKIEILGDQLGAGASIDVETIEPQKCLLVDPPGQQWLPWCEVDR